MGYVCAVAITNRLVVIDMLKYEISSFAVYFGKCIILVYRLRRYDYVIALEFLSHCYSVEKTQQFLIYRQMIFSTNLEAKMLTDYI